MNDKASPRPWTIDGGKGKKNERYIWIAGEYFGGHAIATVHDDMESSQANATLIVEAVNNHDRLKAENERLREVAIRAIEYKSIVPLLAQQAEQALKGE